MTGRKIIHIDMDAFYAAVEQRDRPELLGKPVVVGGDPRGRGVVASCSYEARTFKIHSAMSCKQAQRLCPHAYFIYPDFEKYSAVSERMREIFDSVTDKVEPLSLDEAYLDVTENKLGEPSASRIAAWIRERIRTELDLTASAGVGPNKFIAKVASDFRKPNGLVVVPPAQVSAFVETLPVERLWGVGPVTAKRLLEMGLRTAGQIRMRKESELVAEFGKFGAFIHQLSHGIDDREVESGGSPKSRGTEETFGEDVLDIELLLQTLSAQAEEVAGSLKEQELLAKTVTLKVRYSDFKTITRSKTLQRPVDQSRWIEEIAVKLLLESTEAGATPIRLIGISASGLVGPLESLQLWLGFPEILF